MGRGEGIDKSHIISCRDRERIDGREGVFIIHTSYLASVERESGTSKKEGGLLQHFHGLAEGGRGEGGRGEEGFNLKQHFHTNSLHC